MKPTDNHAKILFKIEKDEDGYPPVDVESLWARRLGENKYELDNIPFYAKGVAPGDEVSVASKSNELWFREVKKSGGRSVFRIYARDDAKIKMIRSSLLDLGCPSEVDAEMGLVACEVPLAVDIVSVINFLVSGQESAEFDFEEGVLRHALPD